MHFNEHIALPKEENILGQNSANNIIYFKYECACLICSLVRLYEHLSKYFHDFKRRTLNLLTLIYICNIVKFKVIFSTASAN